MIKKFGILFMVLTAKVKYRYLRVNVMGTETKMIFLLFKSTSFIKLDTSYVVLSLK